MDVDDQHSLNRSKRSRSSNTSAKKCKFSDQNDERSEHIDITKLVTSAENIVKRVEDKDEGSKCKTSEVLRSGNQKQTVTSFTKLPPSSQKSQMYEVSYQKEQDVIQQLEKIDSIETTRISPEKDVIDKDIKDNDVENEDANIFTVEDEEIAEKDEQEMETPSYLDLGHKDYDIFDEWYASNLDKIEAVTSIRFITLSDLRDLRVKAKSTSIDKTATVGSTSDGLNMLDSDCSDSDLESHDGFPRESLPEDLLNENQSVQEKLQILIEKVFENDDEDSGTEDQQPDEEAQNSETSDCFEKVPSNPVREKESTSKETDFLDDLDSRMEDHQQDEEAQNNEIQNRFKKILSNPVRESSSKEADSTKSGDPLSTSFEEDQFQQNAFRNMCKSLLGSDGFGFRRDKDEEAWDREVDAFTEEVIADYNNNPEETNQDTPSTSSNCTANFNDMNASDIPSTSGPNPTYDDYDVPSTSGYNPNSYDIPSTSGYNPTFYDSDISSTSSYNSTCNDKVLLSPTFSNPFNCSPRGSDLEEEDQSISDRFSRRFKKIKLCSLNRKSFKDKIDDNNSCKVSKENILSHWTQIASQLNAKQFENSLFDSFKFTDEIQPSCSSTS